MIDTLKLTRSFERAGFEPPQAEALAVAISDATAVDREDLATKADLKVLAAELRGEIQAGFAASRGELQAGLAALRGELEAKIANSRTSILWALFGSQVGLFAALLAVARFTDLLR